MFSHNRTWALWLALASTVALPSTVEAGFIGFDGITNNRPSDVAIGEAQLWMEASSPSADKAAFTFYNVGPFQCTITKIYFEEGPLAGIDSIRSSSGVAFSEGGSPTNLPGGSMIRPEFDSEFRVTADNPTPVNGVNNGLPLSGEWVTVTFGLGQSATFQDVLEQLGDGSLRIGLHVQNFASGSSESFINRTPEPATAMLVAAGMGLIAGFRRRRTA